MEGKLLRTIAVMGLVAVVAMAFLMMFSLEQVTDTSVARIAAAVRAEFERVLLPAPPEPVRLTMARDGKGVDAPRLYTLRVRPTEAVAADERALDRLLQRAAEVVAYEVGETRVGVSIRCIADLPGGAARERSFQRLDDMGAPVLRPVESAQAALPGTDGR